MASEQTTREINDFLDKGSSKAESISPEAKGGMREMGEEGGTGREGGGISPCAALHIICMLYTLLGPHHTNDSKQKEGVRSEFRHVRSASSIVFNKTTPTVSSL